MAGNRQTFGEARTFLTRLARDTRGNTLAIMAAALFPLAGLIGGGLDVARMYIVKTRLQHACDAGALAGRKAMGGGTWGQTINDVPNYPDATAERFFNVNYNSQAYGASGVTKAFSENAGKVSGTASAVVPMTVMRIFGKTDETMEVTCEAEMRLPNTDVMFVLDTTGSMNCPVTGACASNSVEQPGSKIAALRVAVKCFYEIVARLDTDAACTGGNPSGGTGSQTQLRFGFVPYATNANVGKLLRNDWFVDQWTYQSRVASQMFGTWASWDGSNLRCISPATSCALGAWANHGTATTQNRSSDCNNAIPTIPPETYEIVAGSSPISVANSETDTQFKTWETVNHSKYQRSYNSSTKICTLQVQTRVIERRAFRNRATASTSGAASVNAWLYRPVAVDVGALKEGSGWKTAGITLPIGNDFTSKTITWDGCIEERGTVRQASYNPIPAGALDLNIDLTPSLTNLQSYWAPALDDVLYPRKTTYSNNSGFNMAEITTLTNFTGQAYSCPTEAKKLQSWTDADAFETYVDSLRASGNTYHDIGLIWGGRLMSPTGLFATENALTPQGGEIERHMIFMTDGDACTENYNYQAYGLAFFDRRQTDPNVVPTGGCTSTGTLTQQVNARTEVLCSAIKNRNITLWVISFGSVASSTVTRLSNCASQGRYFSANDAAALQATFRQIADQISALRLTN